MFYTRSSLTYIGNMHILNLLLMINSCVNILLINKIAYSNLKLHKITNVKIINVYITIRNINYLLIIGIREKITEATM